MIGDLAAYLKSSPGARLNVWLGRNRCPGLYELKGFQRNNWTEVCLGHLAKENRCAAIVANYDDPILIKMLVAFKMTPPVIRDPNEGADASGDSPTLFVPASLDAVGSWAKRIVAAAGEHPWVIAGVSEPTREDREILNRIAATGAEIYWVSQGSSPIPEGIAFPAKRISGHDSDTFFASLLQAQGEFPPGVTAPAFVEDDPEEGLHRLLNDACRVFRDAADDVIKTWLPKEDELAALDDEGYHQRMEQCQRERAGVATLGGENAVRKFVFGTFGLGLFSGGRRADRFFEWSWNAIQDLPASTRLMGFDRFESQMKILLRRARLRTATAAEPFYEEGGRLIRALEPPQPKSVHPALVAADLYAEWSEHKPVNLAHRLIDQAVEILHRPTAARKLSDYQEAPLIHAECRFLRAHALRLSPADARKYLDAAKACAERFAQLTVSSITKSGAETARQQPFLAPERSQGMREYHLGLIALDEARLFPEREVELLEAAGQYFQRMLEETQTNPVWLYLDWGVALGQIARTRDSGLAADLYNKADERMQLSADAGDSANLRASWAALLLDQARHTTGPNREDLLGKAERHARQAESSQAGKGLLHLAGVAALRRQEKEVAGHLRLCARFPAFPRRTAFDADQNLAEIREQNWFQTLVREIYPE